MWKWKNICGIAVCMICFCGCAASAEADQQTVGSLAYDRNKSGDYTVYVKEKDRYVPFLVLTQNYENTGNALLLRKYLLEPSVVLNECSSDEEAGKETDYRTAYYPKTSADIFLSNEYLDRLGICDKIALSEITITDESSENFETIERKIFLLSAAETGNYYEYAMLKEGETLEYFKKTENQKAYTEQGQGSNWWLRTRELSYPTVIYTIGYDKSTGMADVNHNSNYLRPAFCISADTFLQTGEIEGETVYILE